MQKDSSKKVQKLNPAAINESQAAGYLGVSPTTLANWRKEGIGPQHKTVVCPGKVKPRHLYPVASLNQWLLGSDNADA